ncbi:scoloptoxin SSD14-like isoform X2 [Oppia nitens]|uniref:scoloptoxin SSD14-like isoform X2 n=1 Tax=Oppia nitens TaxID=1686743 RepID=UPI0023DA7046|nr:scoloptoxin SSD14-like isoform X2 [Oppia nitens]
MKIRKKLLKVILITVVVIVVIAVAIGVGVYYGVRKDICDNISVETDCPYCQHQSSLGNYCSKTKLGIYNKFAISTDSEPCASIGRKIIDEYNGNAVDSIISVLLCMGVTIPESLGLGGGALILIYNATEDKTYTIDAREVAPAAATENMFDDNHKHSVDGPKAIAVPGELYGYWTMFEKYGSKNVKWEQLFEKAIDLCENGFNVSEHLETALQQKRSFIEKHKSLRDIYINPVTNDLYKEGQVMKQPILGQTLKNISKQEDPIHYYYHILSKIIIEDIKNAAKDWDNNEPIITVDDFKNYKSVNNNSVITKFDLNNITLHSFPLPGSGDLLSFMINVMQRYNGFYPTAANSTDNSTLFYHRLVETYKYAFAQRTHLEDNPLDPNVTKVIKMLRSDAFAKNINKLINDEITYASKSGHYDKDLANIDDDHGTAHVSVVDSQGNAVAVTATINSYFGSKVMSPRTGILLNNEMDDFNTGDTNDFGIPPSKSNKVKPGRRPLSSMCPSVFTDQTGLRLVIGGSGGPKITTTVASVAIRNLFFGEDIQLAIDGQRVHHQLFPDKVIYEKCFPKEILCGLKKKGHTVERLGDNDRGAIIMAIAKNNGKLYANSDYRKGGTVDGV